MNQQLGQIAKAITTGSVSRSGTLQGAILDAPAPTGPIAGYVSVMINGQPVKLAYYES
jgi:hypothetical protein